MCSIAENLREFIHLFALAGGRMVSSPGHLRAREYLINRFQEMGLEFYRDGRFDLSYRVRATAGERELSFWNIVGKIPGTHPNLEPILIGAHYDSVIPGHCADDNAAAVAIAISVAEEVRKHPLKRDVVIAHFDAEEPPYFLTNAMGSTRFFHDQRLSKGFHAVFIMDLVGHDVEVADVERFAPPGSLGSVKWQSRIRDLLFVTGAESSSRCLEVLRNEMERAEMPIVGIRNEYVGDMSDHHVFRQNNIPYLFLSCGRWQHYHQMSDVPENLNYEKMARVRNVLLNLVRSADSTDSDTLPDESSELQLSRESITNAFAPVMPLLLQLVGLESLEHRHDLDRLIEVLQHHLGD